VRAQRPGQRLEQRILPKRQVALRLDVREQEVWQHSRIGATAKRSANKSESTKSRQDGNEQCSEPVACRARKPSEKKWESGARELELTFFIL